MHYLSIRYLQPGMVLAKSIIGDNGLVLLKSQNKITEATLKRLVEMGFQGAYIDTPLFSEIEVDDIIDNDLRLEAFEALKSWNILKVVKAGKSIVKQLKYKETLKLDLLDIKNDKNYLYKHSISVAIFSVVIGIGFGMNEDQLNNLAVAGLLHDIGMTKMDADIIQSEAKLSEKDKEQMKQHPTLGYEILKDNASISSVSRNAILFHHENLDGSGYYKVTADKISIFSRILRVADVYDALTATKKYRDAQAPVDALEYLMANSGKLFDRDVVDIFVKKFPLYPVGFTVRLSNGEAAVIVTNEFSSMRPVVKLFKGKIVNLATDADYRSVLIKEMM